MIADVAARLDAQLTVEPRTSVSPLHRDLRFAPAGSARYKDHLLLTTSEGADKRTAPTLWIRIEPSRAGYASGLGFTPTVRERWRAAVGGEKGAPLAAELDHLVERRRAEVAGERLKNVPASFGADHPRAELLRLSDSPTTCPTRSPLRTLPMGTASGSRSSSPCTAGSSLTSRHHQRRADP